MKRREEGPEIVIESGSIIVKQDTLDMSACMYKIHQQLSEDVEEVHLIAHKCVNINCNLKWEGKNIFLYAPIVSVNTVSVWDVSGGATLPPTGRADDGKEPGESGNDGHAGQPGQSGGHVYICCERLMDGNKLTIKSVGGKGGSGQDGGHGQYGKDGEDGKEILEEDFNKFFPTAAGCHNDDTYHKYLEQAQQGTIKEYLPDSIDIYCTFTAKLELRKVTLAIYRNLFRHVSTLTFARLRQAYCLVEGAPGEVGGDGGDGGCGGPGGCGGKPGSVNIAKYTDCNDIITNHGVNVVKDPGKAGKPGKSGNAGRGGRGGRYADDIGRMEPGEKGENRNTVSGTLAIRFEKKEPTDKRLPFCPKERKYAEIYKDGTKVRKRQVDGHPGDIRKQSDITAKASVTKTAIKARRLMDKYTHMSIPEKG